MHDKTKAPDAHGPDGTMARDPTGLVIIRAWIEAGSSEPLRAQVRLSTNVSAGFERTVTLARPEEVCAAVQEWLADMLSHDRERCESPGNREETERIG
jgi:hypothetical protein